MLIDNLYHHEETIDNLKGRNGKFQLDCQEMGATFIEKSGQNTLEPTFIMLTLKAICTPLSSSLQDHYELRPINFRKTREDSGRGRLTHFGL